MFLRRLSCQSVCGAGNSKDATLAIETQGDLSEIIVTRACLDDILKGTSACNVHLGRDTDGTGTFPILHVVEESIWIVPSAGATLLLFLPRCDNYPLNGVLRIVALGIGTPGQTNLLLLIKCPV